VLKLLPLILVGAVFNVKAIEGAVPVTKEQCRKACSNCRDIKSMQVCSTQCQGIVETGSCHLTVPSITNPTEANEYGNIMFARRKSQLIAENHLADNIIEQYGKVFSGENRSLQAGEVAAVINVLKGLRQGAAGILEKIHRNTQDIEGMKTLQQFQQALGQLDLGIQRIQRARNWTLFDLRKEANAALLFAKNIYNQGATQAFIAKKSRPVVDKAKDTLFCAFKCTSNTCGKDLKIFTKCITSCSESKIKSCIKGAQQPGKQGQASIFDQYQDWLATHRMAQLGDTY
jgi:hypothetical protein